jgi:diguanylate cyclase (GGDEF)-like protein
VTYVAEEEEMVAFLRDISERKRQEELLQQAAFHDVLTDLPNRRMLIDSWRRAAAAATRHGNQGAVLLVDLDHFKVLNDSMGHEAGDAFLRQAATRLRACVRDVDTVARLGGDEFAVLLVDLSSGGDEAAAQAAVVAERIRASMCADFGINNTVYRGGCSIGVTLFRSGHDELDGLLKSADSAMYQAKRSGRNAVRFFDTSMQERATERDARTAELRAALAGEQFLLHYQSKWTRIGKRLAQRRSCAGCTRSAASFRPATSSRWPRRPGSFSNWDCGC